ncbi:hypothetical protein, partial [Klebsiella pneumoniae]|uniref:hypothetical protein n=1 Tax=Klebsiella pneumoniae TaxID=573 RepID=UPI003A806509
ADTGASPVDCLCWLPRDVDAELDGNGKAVFRGVKARSEGRLAVAYWTTEQGEIDPSGILFLTREDIATLWAD